MHRRTAVLLGAVFLLLVPLGHAAAGAADDPVAPVTTSR